MSHHDSIGGNKPLKIDLRHSAPKSFDTLPGNIPAPLTVDLSVSGQGSLVFEIPGKNRPKSANVIFSNKTGQSLLFTINEFGAKFIYRKTVEGEWTDFELINNGKPDHTFDDGYNSSIDDNPLCRYFISIDCLNKRLRFGKGEMRFSTVLLDYQYDLTPTLFHKETRKEFEFIDSIDHFEVTDNISLLTLWKDPVVAEPPAFVVNSNNFTMNDAAEGLKTTASSLSKECQILYGNVADFELNTPDFPDFGQAIEYSMRTDGCIGNDILKYKLENSPFPEGEESEYKELYLRITLGYSQGESPGIPYVMEIWPVGCASPVHHHGYTHAIIKVLRGAIDVDVFRMLPSQSSSNDPLYTVKFNPNDVTYLMPEVNQYHLLKNNLANTDTCITIQCYSYSQNDDIHYSTFDYVENNEIGHFDPISDYSFSDFKAKVKEEWNAYLKTKFWMSYEKEKNDNA